jgi:predicted metal-dependent hydrolase
MSVSLETIRKYYEEAFKTYAKAVKLPDIEVSFYPYVGINNTIRIRKGKVFVRIAEICNDLPASAHRALAHILVAKLFRKKPPQAAHSIYSAAISTDQLRIRVQRNRRRYGRKIITTSKGKYYDLDRVFERLNRKYFDQSLKKPTLTWSSRKTYQILGHHDAAHDTIVISKSLDARTVPDYVVDYVMYHEMLHIKHPARVINGRRYHHTAEFRRAEKNFEKFDEAELWINQNVSKLRQELLGVRKQRRRMLR